MSVTTKTHKPGEIPITSEDHHRRFTQYRDAFKNRGGNCDMFEGFRCLTFPYGAAAPSTCPDSCIPCTEQFVPTSLRNNPIAFQKVELHDDKMAASVIQSLVESTQSDYSFVRDKIQTHGNAIAKRWQKRSAEKREEILRNAVPDMPLDRNADIEQIFEGVNYLVDSMNNRASREEILKQQQTPEEPFLAPCLNIESLREDPMRLLALMHHRSHAHSSEWISFDKEVIQIYFNTGKLRRAYNPQCVVVQGPHFGSLVQWSENEAHWWQMIGYPLARHLLRVQSKIANLLRKVTEVLLDRAAEQAPQGRDFWNHLVSTSFKQEGCFVAASAYYSQVFAPPPRFDPLRIYKLLETRCRAAIDEAQLVQADPLYLRRLLRQVENSTMFALMSEKQKRQMLYMYSIGSMVKRNIWGYMGSVAREMVKYPPQERQGILHLSKEYEKELRKLEAAVRVRFEVLVNELGGFFATSRTFQYHFREGVQITDPEIAFRTDPLFWALVELAAQIVDSNWPAVRCFSFIEEHLAKSSAKERARIDQTLYDHLADMAFTDELLSAIKAHRSYTPLARNSKKATELYEKFVGPSISGIMIDIFHAGRKDAEIHDALQEFSRAPIPKKASNKEKLEYNIALNEKFKEYWHIFRAKSLQRPEVVSLGSEDEAIKRKFREYSEGEAYIFEAKQNAIKTAIAKEEERAQLAKTDRKDTTTAGSFVEHSTEPAHLTGRAIAKNQEAKSKVKTRNTLANRLAKAFGSMDVTPSNTSKPPVYRNTISVRTKTIDFFGQMFSSAEAPQQSPKWVDLLGAMVDAGMSATHSGGSAVTFEDERNKKGAIVLHKPHPDPTVDLVMLKTIGKRLSKWFGWNEETFVEREQVGV